MTGKSPQPNASGTPREPSGSLAGREGTRRERLGNLVDPWQIPGERPGNLGNRADPWQILRER
eukprot:8160461-Pyramimonas_sp.AAC.1